MRFAGLLAMAGLATLLAGGVALAKVTPLERYEARLSGRDHYNSQGVALTTAAAIIRQDRANYHQFGFRDREDQDDNFFRVTANRARLEQLLAARGALPPAVRDRIINGDPVVIVEVYENFVQVRLKYP